LGYIIIILYFFDNVKNNARAPVKDP
jgi:hypothetical protein